MRFDEFPDDPDDAIHPAADRAAAASRSTWTGVAVNLTPGTTQVVVGLLAHSQALVADGLHSSSDLLADFVVLFAGRHARKDADPEHPYGHHRFETAASLVLGALLVGVGVAMLAAALRRLEEPELIPKVHAVALGVAGVALVAKEALFRSMLAIAKRIRSSLLVANAWHARSDALSTLVVGVGVVGNLAGYPILDPIAALVGALKIARMGWTFAWDALHDRARRRDETRAGRAASGLPSS